MTLAAMAAQTGRTALRSSSMATRAARRGTSVPRSSFSTSSRWAAEPAAASKASTNAGPSASSSSSSPKLSTIVDQIEGLTLLEAAELVTLLKTRLNITEMAMPSAAPAAPAGGAAAGGAAAEGQDAEAEKPKEKTIFALKLMGLKDASAKAKVIKEVKALNSTMNLVEAKKFVESAPQILKEGLNKEDVEKLKKAIETAGGTVEIE